MIGNTKAVAETSVSTTQPAPTQQRSTAGELEGRKVSCWTKCKEWFSKNKAAIIAALLVVGAVSAIFGVGAIIAGLCIGAKVLSNIGMITAFAGCTILQIHNLIKLLTESDDVKPQRNQPNADVEANDGKTRVSFSDVARKRLVDKDAPTDDLSVKVSFNVGVKA